MVIIEDAVPVIIEKELWERVQKRMDANKHNTVNKTVAEGVYSFRASPLCAMRRRLCGYNHDK